MKASALQLCSKGTPAQVFSCELWEIFQHTFFKEFSELTASVSGGVQSSNQLLFLQMHPSGGTTCWYQPWFDFFLFYLSVCFNIQNLNLCSAVVLASPNIFAMEIKAWQSLISDCSRNTRASPEHLMNGN